MLNDFLILSVTKDLLIPKYNLSFPNISMKQITDMTEKQGYFTSENTFLKQ